MIINFIEFIHFNHYKGQTLNISLYRIITEEGEASDASPTGIRPENAFPPAPEIPTQVGCAAALICVEEQYCTMTGVISPDPVRLTSQQLTRRAPLSVSF